MNGSVTKIMTSALLKVARAEVIVIKHHNCILVISNYFRLENIWRCFLVLSHRQMKLQQNILNP